MKKKRRKKDDGEYADKYFLIDEASRLGLTSQHLMCLPEAIASCAIEGYRPPKTKGEWRKLLSGIAKRASK